VLINPITVGIENVCSDRVIRAGIGLILRISESDGVELNL